MSIATALSPRAPDPASTSPEAAPILIVDDNPAKRLALRAVLEPLGYEVVEADSGSACLRCVMANVFAVILLDVRMPIMDGFETAALIRLRAETEMTPIIFITAHESQEVVADRYAAGAVDFITAPVDPHELRAKVAVLANLFMQAQANAAKARELQGTADQLRLLTETAPVGIFQIDAQNRYSYTNARWAEITGVSSEVAAGAEWDVMVDAEQEAATLAEFETYVLGEEFSSRLRIATPEGSHRIVMLTSRPVLDADGRPSGWVGTLADITAEAAAAEAMAEARDHATEALRLKSDFLSNMSHEIRTPMSGIIGWTELLLDTDLDASQRSCVESLTKAGDTLLNVVNAILDFSKIENGQLAVENVEFSPRTIVDEVVDLLALSARDKGLELTALLDDSVPAVVIGDPNRLRQVLTNLTGNAIKFTHAGQITIRVTAETAGSDTVIGFEVSDTGVGIAADQLGLIFEPFTQADTSITRKYGGTGLGLTISSRLTALMGGQIGVDSELGVGSTFWFTISVHHVVDGLTGDVDIADDETLPAGIARAAANGSHSDQASPSLNPRRQEG
jgi:PAS domain S-box-containing protein